MAGFDAGRGFKAITAPLNPIKNPNPIKNLKLVTNDVKQTFSPDAPSVTPTPGLPTVDQARIDMESADTIRRRRGRSANVLAGNSAVPNTSLAVQSLLG